ncbi:MAG: UbiA family prenyltransferase [Verrucomicrobiales bacterium]|nr:UbiA family prenyltransferase [Verrucomicrobiales bacterium]
MATAHINSKVIVNCAGHGYVSAANLRHGMGEQGTTTTELAVPICTDLDGTLIKTDLLWESAVRLLTKNPIWVFALPVWWARGRAYLKRQIASRVRLDPARLPYNGPFLEFLRAEKMRGRKLVLASASDAELVRAVADYLGIFDEVMGSDGRANLRGAAKADALVGKFGLRGFDYAGNAKPDLAVWQKARHAIVVARSTAFADRVRHVAELAHTFLTQDSRLSALFRAIRPHQWVKNLIVFAPLIASHKIFEWPLVGQAAITFAAFCLCAVSSYILNDLLDLDADREHRAKTRRPFAAGELPLQFGLALIPLTAICGLVLGATLGLGVVCALAAYLILSFSYSAALKKVALLDAFVLAALYTLRLIAGHEATGVAYSNWLLMFCMFIFLSLALVKRFHELRLARSANRIDLARRGYLAGDIELVGMLGLSCGVLAVLVLALYVTSREVLTLYKHPMFLLLGCPLLLYWLSRVWLIAHRGQMHDDPVVFTLKDWQSYVIGLLILLVMLAATG